MRKKCDFWDFKGINFLSPKKVSFYLEYYERFFSPFFDQEQIKKKNGIFGQNYGLTPLQKICDFWDVIGI